MREATAEKLGEAGGFDLVLSDMAPSTSGALAWPETKGCKSAETRKATAVALQVVAMALRCSFRAALPGGG